VDVDAFRQVAIDVGDSAVTNKRTKTTSRHQDGIRVVAAPTMEWCDLRVRLSELGRVFRFELDGPKGCVAISQAPVVLDVEVILGPQGPVYSSGEELFHTRRELHAFLAGFVRAARRSGLPVRAQSGAAHGASTDQRAALDATLKDAGITELVRR
jgi:hypothetical protein